MAEQIKFRLTAAKVGVSMALLALVGGVVDRVRSGPTETRITPASGGYVLHRAWPSKYGGQVKVIQKLEQKWVKLDTALMKLEQKLVSQYLKVDTADTTFLTKHLAGVKYETISNANTEFLKIRDAAAKFLTVGEAAEKWLKVDVANRVFLKIRSANAEFLKIKSAQSEYVQGHGGVVSGAATVPILVGLNQPTPLLRSPDGLLSAALEADSTHVALTIHNATTDDITFVVDAETDQTEPFVHTVTLKAGGDEKLAFTPNTEPREIHVQFYPSGTFNQAVTLTVSVQAQANNQVQAVGQMLIGNL